MFCGVTDLVRVGRVMAAAMLMLVVVLPAVCDAREYVLLVDCTGTMRYEGRGDATMQALGDLVGAASPGDFVSVYGYGEEPFPALSEYPWRVETGDSWSAMRSRLTLPFEADRTDITKGLELVWSERELVLPSAFEPSGSKEAPSCVVLLTDGKLIPCYDDYSQYGGIYARSRARLLDLAKLFGEAGVPIYSVGLGAEEKVDGGLLAEVSEVSGGRYLHSATSGELDGVFGQLIAAVTVAKSEPGVSGARVAEAPSPAGAAQGDVAEAATRRAGAEPDRRREDADATGHSNETAAAGQPDGEKAASGGSPRNAAALGAYAARAAFRDIASTVHQTVLGVLGVVVGFVAIGVQRKQSWTHAFTKPLLQREIRVKGYLRPTYPEGMVGVRCCIPIENPGLPAVEVGEGAEFGMDLDGILVEMVGTVDGSPPTIRVLRGEVKVNGAVVEDSRKLEDQDVLEFGDKLYVYLRGCRR